MSEESYIMTEAETSYEPKNIFLTGAAGTVSLVNAAVNLIIMLIDGGVSADKLIFSYYLLTNASFECPFLISIHSFLRFHRLPCCHPSRDEVPPVQYRRLR